MKINGAVRSIARGKDSKRMLAVQLAAILLLLAALPLSAQDKKDPGTIGSGDSIGFIASKNPDPSAIGLPLYPGARPYQDKSGDNPKFQLGLWGGSKGFNLVVLKFESNDSPQKITAFYHKALGKYGKVLNCSDSPKAADQQDQSDPANGLDCKADEPDSGETLLKAGTKEKQHVFSIKPEAGLSIFQLVYVEMPPSVDKK
jgi:hypothetical protein